MVVAAKEVVEVVEIVETPIVIDPEFEALIPPLAKDERSQLEENILTYGCRDPLVIWKHHNILLDGHNRYEICTRLDVPFKTVEIHLETREEAYNWLIDNQLGRRNLTPQTISYLRGKRYHQEKVVGYHNDTRLGKTAENLAKQYKVGSATINRDAKFANAVDKIGEVLGEDTRQEILGGDSNLTQKDTLKLAEIIKTKGEEEAKSYLHQAKVKALKKSPYKWGDRVVVADGEFTGQAGSVTGSAGDGVVTVQLDSGSSESINLEFVKLEPLARVENDFYPTARVLTEKLIEEVEIKGQVLEPCAGDGAIASLFNGSISNDLFPQADFEPDYTFDSTDPESWEHWEANGGYDWVITNPPFNEASKILPLAWKYTQKGMAMLLRLSYLEPCDNRADWLKEYSDNLTNVIVFNPRPKFRKDTEGSDNVTVAWFVWRKDWSWERFGVKCPFSFVTGWR